VSLLDCLYAVVAACAAAFLLGSSFTYGVVCICRIMRWAPVNTTVNIYNVKDGDE